MDVHLNFPLYYIVGKRKFKSYFSLSILIIELVIIIVKQHNDTYYTTQKAFMMRKIKISSGVRKRCMKIALIDDIMQDNNRHMTDGSGPD